MRYEKGRKDATRSRIVDVATERFRSDGIAAAGLAGIMAEAGLTNGAFYPHFQSKSALVSACLLEALDKQSNQLQDILKTGGVDAVIDEYLSIAHRDNPGQGCASAALLPELARATSEIRMLYTEQLLGLAGALVPELSAQNKDPEALALSIIATLIGTLQLARAVTESQLSDRILEAGRDAASALAQPREKEKPA